MFEEIENIAADLPCRAESDGNIHPLHIRWFGRQQDGLEFVGRREVQLVFQDPSSSLNPRKRVGQIVASPMLMQGVKREAARARVRELLDSAGGAAGDARVAAVPWPADRPLRCRRQGSMS